MHDARMLAVSDLYNDLENFAFCPARTEMCLYGDPAYPLRVHLQAPFRVGVLTRQMEIFNEKMSAVRASVEWLFADIINYFKFLDFKKNLRIGLSQVGKMYIVCAILRNALTCLYSNTTAEYFGVDPPSLQTIFVNFNLTAQIQNKTYMLYERTFKRYYIPHVFMTKC